MPDKLSVYRLGLVLSIRTMDSEQHILVLDQSTTTSSAFAFDLKGRVRAHACEAFLQYLPRDGWVEHDATEIWQSVLVAIRKVVAQIEATGGGFIGMSITNQRETAVIWDRARAVPLHHALVWQDRRTAAQCDNLRDKGHEEDIRARTGLLLDPYFSASKFSWMLDTIEDGRARAMRGELACGTIDSWLIYRLTGGAHLTDATNAARTSLFNIHRNDWDDHLCALFSVPRALLPEVRDCADHFGLCDSAHFGHALPILGVAGDQQAAAFGQVCFAPKMIKATYGTGCFMLAHTGMKAMHSQNRLLTTIASRLNGKICYALEGSIFMAGAIMHWLRDRVGVITDVDEVQALVASANPESRLLLVPAFVGLGAPHWQPEARAAFFNMTQSDGRAEIVRAALMSVSFQTADLVAAMGADMALATLQAPNDIRVDGGMVVNDWFVQNLADITGCGCVRPQSTETTALGAAYLALLSLNYYDQAGLTALWHAERRFTPELSDIARAEMYQNWQAACAATIAIAT